VEAAGAAGGRNFGGEQDGGVQLKVRLSWKRAELEGRQAKRFLKLGGGLESERRFQRPGH